MIALSYSALKDAECPFRFNALRIAKTYREPETDAMRVGSTFANIVDRYRKRCFKLETVSDLEFLDTAVKTWGFVGDGESSLQETLVEMVDRFKSSPFAVVPAGKAQWWETEMKCVYDSELNPILHPAAWRDTGAAFRGVVDFAYREGDKLVIVDDKTGRGKPDPLQLKIYGALLPRTIGFSPCEIATVFNIVVGKPHIMEFAPADLRPIDEYLKGRIKAVNSWTDFPAASCDACRWCTVPGCPIRNVAVATIEEEISKIAGVTSLSMPTEISTKDQAEKALQFVVFAEDVVSNVKELLRGYLARNGSVVAAGKVAELKPNETWKATSVEKIVKTLAAYQIPVSQVWETLSITESAIEKLLKKNKASERLPMILHFGERKTGKPMFSITNHKVDLV